MGLMIDLEPELQQRLDALSALTGRNVAEHVHEAILRGLEDLEDLAEAEAVMERVRRGEERTYSLEEVEKELGLAD